MTVSQFRPTSSALSAAVLRFTLVVLTLSGSTVAYGLDHSGNITSNETWSASDNPHIVTGSIHVYSGATLTIEKGCEVKFNSTTALYVGYFSAGTLIAEGTADHPITFTSNASTPAPGDWKGIVFFNSTDDGATLMDHCIVEYGGQDSYNSNINCNNASPVIQKCIVRHSDGHGIYVRQGDPRILCSTIADNTHGVYVDSGNPFMADCSITGNTAFGVYNGTNSVTIGAENNWWGDSSGPGGAGPGTGDAVSDYVDYEPWLTASDSCFGTVVLEPASGANVVGSEHTVIAEARDESDIPVEGVVVSFVITAGPHAGLNGNDTTDASGQAAFSYTGTLEGTDTIVASFVDFHGRTRTSNSVTMTWGPINTPPVALCRNVTVPAGAGCSADASIDNGSYDPDSGDTIEVSQSPGGPYSSGTT